jgi:hypothetical protein
MPARPPVPNVIQFSFLHTSNIDTPMVNRVFFQYSGSAPTPTEMTTLVTNAISHWTGNVQKYQSNEWSLTSATGTDLTSATSAEETVTSGLNGTASAASAPFGAAMVISHKIARRYRGGHPRTYLGGFPFDQIADGFWSTAEYSNIVAGWAAYIAAMLTEAWSGGAISSNVAVSFYTGFLNHTFPSGRVRPVPQLRPTPLVDQIVADVVHTAVASQRRRNPVS